MEYSNKCDERQSNANVFISKVTKVSKNLQGKKEEEKKMDKGKKWLEEWIKLSALNFPNHKRVSETIQFLR